MPLTSLTKLQGALFGNVTATSLTSNAVTASNTVTSQIYAVSLTAGETLAALDVVYLEPTLTQGTAGRVYKMDADVLIKSTQAMFVGFALAAASAAANVSVQISGIVSGFTGLTTGAMYYASSTAGAITATKPLHPLPVGIAISTTQLLINTRKREQEESENVSAVYGYAMGGNTGATVTSVEKLTFSTGIFSSSSVSAISVARESRGLSDTSIYGYAVAGYDGASYISTTDRIAFSTGATAASSISAPSSTQAWTQNFSDGSIYGYVLGGVSSSGSQYINVLGFRLTFATSITAASTASNLSLARYSGAGISDASVYGYALGGWTGSSPPSSVTDRTTFSTSTTAASTVSNLSQGRYFVSGLSDGAVYGYAAGGYTTAVVATGDRITFSTGVTAASTGNNLSAARYDTTTFSDGNTYGYSAGGYSTARMTTTDRTTFATSTTAAYTTGNMLTARNSAAGLSDGAV